MHRRKRIRQSSNVLQEEVAGVSSRRSADEIPLVPFKAFQKGARIILANTKKESDRQLAVFQASNARKREAKKKQ